MKFMNLQEPLSVLIDQQTYNGNVLKKFSHAFNFGVMPNEFRMLRIPTIMALFSYVMSGLEDDSDVRRRWKFFAEFFSYFLRKTS